MIGCVNSFTLACCSGREVGSGLAWTLAPAGSGDGGDGGSTAAGLTCRVGSLVAACSEAGNGLAGVLAPSYGRNGAGGAIAGWGAGAICPDVALAIAAGRVAGTILSCALAPSDGCRAGGEDVLAASAAGPSCCAGSLVVARCPASTLMGVADAVCWAGVADNAAAAGCFNVVVVATSCGARHRTERTTAVVIQAEAPQTASIRRAKAANFRRPPTENHEP